MCYKRKKRRNSYAGLMSTTVSEVGGPEARHGSISSQYGSMLITQALLKSRQSANKTERRLEYSDAGRGIFAQSDPSTDDKTFNYLKSDFGLVLDGSWPALKAAVRDLNASCLEDYAERVDNCPLGGYEEHQVRYKVLFLARHGQGYHNLAIEIYGQKEWDDYWSKLDGDGNIVWGPDPELTPLGSEQATRNNLAWKKQIEKQIPLPQSFYVSPFTRATDTYHLTWNDIDIPKRHRRESISHQSDPRTGARHNSTASYESTSAVLVPASDFPPLVVEDLRETIGVHTCDKRNTRTFIHNRYPKFEFERGFTEEDELWTADYRETPAEQNVRTRRFLDALFESDWDASPTKRQTYVSVTAHSGVINSFLEVTGHRPFNVSTGGMIPVIVKATRKEQF